MAMAACEIAYHEPGEWLSPIFSHAERKGDEIVLHFDHGGREFIVADGKPSGFEVCISGEWISDCIDVRTQGGTVILNVPKGKIVTGVRYAWSNNPKNADLYAVPGLPVSPFEITIA